jgi:hypothetical protein
MYQCSGSGPASGPVGSVGLPDPHPDSLVRGTDLRIRICIQIRTKMSRIRNTGKKIGTGTYQRFVCVYYTYKFFTVLQHNGGAEKPFSSPSDKTFNE